MHRLRGDTSNCTQFTEMKPSPKQGILPAIGCRWDREKGEMCRMRAGQKNASLIIGKIYTAKRWAIYVCVSCCQKACPPTTGCRPDFFRDLFYIRNNPYKKQEPAVLPKSSILNDTSGFPTGIAGAFIWAQRKFRSSGLRATLSRLVQLFACCKTFFA